MGGTFILTHAVDCHCGDPPGSDQILSVILLLIKRIKIPVSTSGGLKISSRSGPLGPLSSSPLPSPSPPSLPSVKNNVFKN